MTEQRSSAIFPMVPPPAVTVRRDAQQARSIAVAIRAAEKSLRSRWPVLNWQNTLGMGFLLSAAACFAASSLAYLHGYIAAWACILINAVAFSIFREVEHDLIHNLYFRGQSRRQYFIMFCIWPFLGNYVNPIYRRRMHLLHHRTSGQVEDLEERLIGNGLSFGFVRFLAMFDTALSLPFRLKELRTIPGFSLKQFALAIFPFGVIFLATWYAFLAYHLAVGAAWLAGTAWSAPAWMVGAMTIVNLLAVVWIVPNMLRQLALALLSSNNHYCGDVEHLMQQTQVLRAWYLLPLQALSCNFGSTHAIHHFVAGQPFYLRQLVAPAAYAAMRENGVRFNDLGTVARANRYEHAKPALSPAQKNIGRELPAVDAAEHGR